MEAFFDREVQRLNFTTQRMDVRTKEKKAIDTAKVEAGDKVGGIKCRCEAPTFVYIFLCMLLTNFISDILCKFITSII